MNSIEEEWRIFREAAIPGDAPLVQLEEMKKAFFAGATIGLLMDSNDDVARLNECAAFCGSWLARNN